MNLALLGPEGNFNRQIAQTLCDKLDFFFLDTDALIRYEHSEIGGPLSSEEFLSREAGLCRRLSDFERTVICCGESLPCFEANVRALSEGAVLVGLTCPRDELYRRRKAGGFYLPRADLGDLVREQKHLPLCDLKVRTGPLTAESDFAAFADSLLSRLAAVRPDFFQEV